ncbi:MAG: dihydroorotate dehydrogenase [Treponema sp.]|jgi:dihydroorotate dehydrogenase (NAD+) catalytic subunit|nr:dihydroorotate dehydrogenase [Treponema sp.]
MTESNNTGSDNSAGYADSGADIGVTIAGVRFRNPVIAASGTFGFGSEYSGLIDVSQLGGICTKGLTFTPRQGNKGMRLWETASGLLNSIGLENSGVPFFIENELPKMKQLGPVIIANISGEMAQDYISGAVLLNNSPVDMVELNISCPNVKAGGMAFGLDPGTAAALVAAVRRVCSKKPLIVKLSPNAPSLTSVALACVKAGADALSLVNTIKAMAIDTEKRKPVFENISAGLSGPAIKPIALRMVWELYGSIKNMDSNVPIIGIGGISTVQDALEFLMAGAAAIQVGTATFAHPAAMTDIIGGIRQYVKTNNMKSVSQISIRE